MSNPYLPGAGEHEVPGVRLPRLDQLRGLAVMGILLMNIVAFALPEGAYFNPHAVPRPGAADLALWWLGFVLVDGKMRAIFAMLFGAGTLLILARAAEAGAYEARIHLRRMAVLALFGLAHFYLLWSGDILFQYAAVGTILLLFALRSTRALVWLGVASLAINLALAAATVHTVALIAADPALSGDWHRLASQLGGGDRTALAAEAARMRAPWPALVGHRVHDQGTLPFVALAATGFETLGMMLLGMAGLRSGFLSGAWPRRLYARAALAGYALALPPMIGLAGWTMHAGFAPLTAFAIAMAWVLPVRPVLALAHVAAALWWLGDGRARPRLAAVGALALSNYLGTSLVMTTLFYGQGLGLFARLDRLALVAVSILAWALMLAWSPAWQRRFHHGPAEWLWRSLARRTLQPLKRSIAKH